jgi:NAD-dependent SIR2 family protein deacetylase
MSQGSGLGTFRGQNALRPEDVVKKFNAAPNYNGPRLHSFADISTAKIMEEYPNFAWTFWKERFDSYAAAAPHESYADLLELLKGKLCFFVTSNIDGLWQRALTSKSSSTNDSPLPSDPRLWEIHGNCVGALQCSRAPLHCKAGVWDGRAAIQKIQIGEDGVTASSLPLCPLCSSIARPNVMMFSDFAFEAQFIQEQEMRYRQYIGRLGGDMGGVTVLEIGAGKGVPTLRVMGEELAKQGAAMIRVSLEDACWDARELQSRAREEDQRQLVLLKGEAAKIIERLKNSTN